MKKWIAWVLPGSTFLPCNVNVSRGDFLFHSAQFPVTAGSNIVALTELIVARGKISCSLWRNLKCNGSKERLIGIGWGNRLFPPGKNILLVKKRCIFFLYSNNFKSWTVLSFKCLHIRLPKSRCANLKLKGVLSFFLSTGFLKGDLLREW